MLYLETKSIGLRGWRVGMTCSLLIYGRDMKYADLGHIEKLPYPIGYGLAEPSSLDIGL